ncbi:hypothetical protein VTI74DRAFT_11442 [Chaetomium olivicolor]
MPKIKLFMVIVLHGEELAAWIWISFPFSLSPLPLFRPIVLSFSSPYLLYQSPPSFSFCSAGSTQAARRYPRPHHGRAPLSSSAPSSPCAWQVSILCRKPAASALLQELVLVPAGTMTMSPALISCSRLPTCASPAPEMKVRIWWTVWICLGRVVSCTVPDAAERYGLLRAYFFANVPLPRARSSGPSASIAHPQHVLELGRLRRERRRHVWGSTASLASTGHCWESGKSPSFCYSIL